jgi:hypothetical protein
LPVIEINERALEERLAQLRAEVQSALARDGHVCNWQSLVWVRLGIISAVMDPTEDAMTLLPVYDQHVSAEDLESRSLPTEFARAKFPRVIGELRQLIEAWTQDSTRQNNALAMVKAVMKRTRLPAKLTTDILEVAERLESIDTIIRQFILNMFAFANADEAMYGMEKGGDPLAD